MPDVTSPTVAPPDPPKAKRQRTSTGGFYVATEGKSPNGAVTYTALSPSVKDSAAAERWLRDLVSKGKTPSGTYAIIQVKRGAITPKSETVTKVTL